MNFGEWKKQNPQAEIDLLIAGAEQLLNHQGLLKLHSLLGLARNPLILVDKAHPACAALLRDIATARNVLLASDNEMAAAVVEYRPVRVVAGRDASNSVEFTRALRKSGSALEVFDPSSSSFVNVMPQEMRSFLQELGKEYSCEEIIGKLRSLRDLKVLVVGEAIIDEYMFCETMNKSNKEPILAALFNYSEKYAGGALAVANHISGFCTQVRLLTRLGAENPQEEFIRSKLKRNVEPEFLFRCGSPTILKQRIVEKYLSRKMFEVYYMNSRPQTDAEERDFLAALERQMEWADVVVVADYGHGLFSQAAVDLLCHKARFLAVNAQTNAGNRGFNLISKYHRADFISIDTPEAQLECRDKMLPVDELIRQIGQRTNCQRLTITMGRQGNVYLYGDSIYHIPVLSLKVVDTIGAGDALLSVCSCAAACDFSPQLTGFVGNIAGAEACTIMGNKDSISLDSMCEHIRSMWRMAGLEQ